MRLPWHGLASTAGKRSFSYTLSVSAYSSREHAPFCRSQPLTLSLQAFVPSIPHQYLVQPFPLATMDLVAAELAWHMRCYAADLRHEWITPNALLYAWESDLLTVTPDGEVCEIEIKCSRSDLLHDLKKPKHSQGMLMNGSFLHKPPTRGRTRGEKQEEQRRSAGFVQCRRPNYFCFALPCAIYRKLQPGALPAYAGVYTVDEEGRVFEERRPIQLHSERITTDDLLALARRVHHRYWDQIRRARHAPGTVPDLDQASMEAVQNASGATH